MNTKTTSHIDVTEEESLLFQDLLLKQAPQSSPKRTTVSFKKTLFVVLGLHVIGAAAVFGLPQTTDVKSIIKDLLPKEPVVVSSTTVSPSPTPETPAVTPTSNALVETNPQTVAPILTKTQPVASSVVAKAQPVVPTVVAKAQPVVPTTAKLIAPTPVKEYVVKKGDNFNKIVKKYKLNSQTLIKLNNIKNTNSLKIGQKLKFM